MPNVAAYVTMPGGGECLIQIEIQKVDLGRIEFTANRTLAVGDRLHIDCHAPGVTVMVWPCVVATIDSQPGGPVVVVATLATLAAGGGA